LRVVEEALEWLDIRELAREPYASLPAADQKRVQLARVLAQVLDVQGELPIHWLLDEPVAHLEADGLAALERVIQMLMRRHACLVFAIRDPRHAARIADQLLVMEGGTFVEESTHATPFRPASIARWQRASSRGNA